MSHKRKKRFEFLGYTSGSLKPFWRFRINSSEMLVGSLLLYWPS